MASTQRFVCWAYVQHCTCIPACTPVHVTVSVSVYLLSIDLWPLDPTVFACSLVCRFFTAMAMISFAISTSFANDLGCVRKGLWVCFRAVSIWTHHRKWCRVRSSRIKLTNAFPIQYEHTLVWPFFSPNAYAKEGYLLPITEDKRRQPYGPYLVIWAVSRDCFHLGECASGQTAVPMRHFPAAPMRHFPEARVYQ